MESSVDNQVLPDWLERPGAPEAVEVGADLRGRYDKLKVASGVKSDEASQLFEKVEAYESEYNKFNDWLGGQKAVIGSFTPPAVTVEELRVQLQQVEVRDSWIDTAAFSLCPGLHLEILLKGTKWSIENHLGGGYPSWCACTST